MTERILSVGKEREGSDVDRIVTDEGRPQLAKGARREAVARRAITATFRYECRP